MISEARKVELVAQAWDQGETPVEIPLVKEDFNSIQLKVQELLETKEFGKVIRRYPAGKEMSAGEIVLWYRAFTDEFRGRQIVGGVDEADLDKNFKEHKTYCSQRVFSANELYAMKPSRVFYDLYGFVGTHIQEINNWDLQHEDAEAKKRIEIRQIAFDCPDGRRTWELDTIWFDGKPVMVVNSSGRDGDEYSERFITDGDSYAAMVRFLQEHVEGDTVTGFVKADAIIPAMTEFYGRTIHDFYDVVTQTPKKS